MYASVAVAICCYGLVPLIALVLGWMYLRRHHSDDPAIEQSMQEFSGDADLTPTNNSTATEMKSCDLIDDCGNSEDLPPGFNEYEGLQPSDDNHDGSNAQDLVDGDDADVLKTGSEECYKHIVDKRHIERKKIEASLTMEQRKQETRIQREQLREMFQLMEGHGDKFGIHSVKDMEDQMKFYIH